MSLSRLLHATTDGGTAKRFDIFLKMSSELRVKSPMSHKRILVAHIKTMLAGSREILAKSKTILVSFANELEVKRSVLGASFDRPFANGWGDLKVEHSKEAGIVTGENSQK